MDTYQHTQHGGLHRIFLLVSVALLAAAWLARSDREVMAITLVVSGIFLLTTFMFASLTIRDAGDWLAVRFGPLSVFRRRIRYADITAVEPDRTLLIDGLGIHRIPGRGRVYNLWGRDCVNLTLGSQTIRLGSDDVPNLVEFLKRRIAANRLSTPSSV
jgi:hypothetical protein